MGKDAHLDRRGFLKAAGGMLAAFFVNPPVVKRGLDSHGPLNDPPDEPGDCLGIHWLRGRIKHADVVAVRDYCAMIFGDYEQNEYGLWKYDRSCKWSNGIWLNYQETEERSDWLTGGYAVLEIPGHVLETLDFELASTFMRGLEQWHFDCTRMDVYFDDFRRLVTPRQLYPMVYEVDLLGNEFRREFTGFLTCGPGQDAGGKRKGKLKGRGLTYDCIHFGKRGNAGGGKYLRIYDKWLESGGSRNCVRWELELTKERAAKLWNALLHTPSAGWTHLIGLAIGGCIDFRHRKVNGNGELLKAGDKNWKRCPRFEFWQKILWKLGELPMSTPVKPKRVETAAKWFKAQTAGTMQMLTQAWGADKLLSEIVDIIGRKDRMNASHRAAVEAYQASLKDKPLPPVSDLREWADAKGIELEAASDLPDPVRLVSRRFVLTGRTRWPGSVT